MNRRNVFFGSAAGIAGLAGLGAAWLRERAPLQSTPPSGSVAVSGLSRREAFWDLSFDGPDGQAFKTSQFRGKPLLVNFWATWCPPCIEELPLLDSFYKAQKASFQILGLAVDQPAAVLKWLAAKPLSFKVGMAGLAGTELSKSLGNASGGLPFTAVFASSGALMESKIGKVSVDDLMKWTTLQ